MAKTLLRPMDEAGRIILPKVARTQLHLSEGDILALQLEGKTIMLSKYEDFADGEPSLDAARQVVQILARKIGPVAVYNGEGILVVGEGYPFSITATGKIQTAAEKRLEDKILVLSEKDNDQFTSNPLRWATVIRGEDGRKMGFLAGTEIDKVQANYDNVIFAADFVGRFAVISE